MTKKMLGMKNRNGLKLDDLRMLVRAAEGMSPYVKLKGRVKMNGTLVELSIDEPDDPTGPVDLDPWTPPSGHTNATAHPIDSRRVHPND
jgi:hypothetical protein